MCIDAHAEGIEIKAEHLLAEKGRSGILERRNPPF